ncbi:hypothetical protein SAMN02745121_06663 [Nannocystis exedens]|uniref:Uncharacterized protein n=1 Tax=Nannocystis exedens TaxID=54 RepID=A0A1I2FI63_9BACT|nr:hypothetical protein [Nannocystis exedens]PCC70429.1 hypothetical protein NAEX_03472 [Nannocystis exedens]SFF04437.1 hypothetical protein SAMN02745121_06663 [Nannocystis exedens]
MVVEFFEAELHREPGASLDNDGVWAHRDSYLPEQHQRRES